MSTLYSLEESLERSAIAVLEAETDLADVRIVSADESDEDTLPQITVRAEKLDEVVRGMQTWNCRLTITLTTAADETPQEEKDERRLPDEDDDDNGAPGFKSLWKALSDLVDADQGDVARDDDRAFVVAAVDLDGVAPVGGLERLLDGAEVVGDAPRGGDGGERGEGEHGERIA
jgi:hypothetical protein